MAEYIVKLEGAMIMADLADVDERNLERIVRCRDCKHNGSFRVVDVGWHRARIIDCEDVTPDGFCAWGERKED